jgi:hypothetical protein
MLASKPIAAIASVRSTRQAPQLNPHSARGTPQCHTARDFVPWRLACPLPFNVTVPDAGTAMPIAREGLGFLREILSEQRHQPSDTGFPQRVVRHGHLPEREIMTGIGLR